MGEAPNNDDFLSNPAPAPHAIGAPAHQAPKPKAKPKPVRPANDLAEQLRQAPVAAEPQPRGEPDPHPTDSPTPGPGADGGRPPPRSGRPKGEIWDGCPVKMLGVNGDFHFLLDRHGQMRSFKGDIKATAIVSYFGSRRLLCTHFSKIDRNGDTVKGAFNSQNAAFVMVEAASERGLFNPDGAVRGVGAWKAEDGSLIYHTGGQLITVGGTVDPGIIDGLIYPAYPPIPAPSLTAGRGDPAEEALALLSSWAWSRPDVDPVLALGAVGCMMLGGALDWRPAFWFTGDKASGKSTLQELIKWLNGDKGLIQSSDPTKSGITARLGHSSLPVALDELEPGDEGSSKERDIIVLARVAASGGQWLRGTADQKGASGNVYSTFMFSSILIPGAMGAQDRSRLITFNMFPPAKDAPKPSIDPRTWKARGATLKRTLIDRWPGWAERLQLWREALARHDMAGRNGDNWATCMAMADMALYADLPSAERLDIWARKIAFAARAETAEIGSNSEDMLTHLIGQPFDVFRRGELWNIGHWLMVAGELPGAPRDLVAVDGGLTDLVARAEAAKRANEKLAKIGLRVKGVGTEAELFMPNARIPGLMRLFEHSQWAMGVWSQAARRVPGAKVHDVPLRLAGQQTRGVYIPFTSIAGLLSLPMDYAAPSPTRDAPATPSQAISSQDAEDFI